MGKIRPISNNWGGKSKRDRLQEAEQILADKNAGMRHTELMKKYNLSRSSIHNRINKAIETRVNLTVDRYRELENANLEEQSARITEQMNIADSMIKIGIEATPPNLTAINRGAVMRQKALDSQRLLSERRAKLNGLDAPILVQATTTEVTQADLQLQDMIRQATAQGISTPPSSSSPNSSPTTSTPDHNLIRAITAGDAA